MKVDLPEPDGPMTATNSPDAMTDGDAAQGVDLARPERVVLDDALRLDERRRHH